jgi:hypothetical protein
MDTAIGRSGLALCPSLLNSPILHGIAPELTTKPDAVVGAIPLLDAFKRVINAGCCGTLAPEP